MTGRRSFAELTERGKCGTYFAGVRSELFGVIRSSVQSCAGMGQCGPWNEHGNSMVRERTPGELAKVFGTTSDWHGWRDGEYVATCAEFPSLSWLEADEVSALRGMKDMVQSAVEDMLANGEE